MSGRRRNTSRSSVSPLSSPQDGNYSEEEEEGYDIAPPARHGNPFDDDDDTGPYVMAGTATPLSVFSSNYTAAEEDLMEEIEEFEDIPPAAHYAPFEDEDSTFSMDSSDDDDDDIIIAAPPQNYQGYFDDESLDGVGRHRLVGRSLWAKGTILARVVALNANTAGKNITNKDNKEQAKNALKIAANVTKIPLGPIWNRVTQVFFIVVFLSNIAVAIADMVLDKDPLKYKLTSLFLGAVEQFGLLFLWIFLWRRRKITPDYWEKKQQYIENALHELLLYPLLILSIVGFATDRFYINTSDIHGFEMFQMALLSVDMLNLLWTQLVRMYMLYRFMEDVDSLLHPDTGGKPAGVLESPGNTLQRAYLSAVGNTILLLYLTVIMGAQLDKDNESDGDYNMSWRSAILALSFVVLPIFSIVLFLLVNSFWLLEILMTINVKTATDVQFQGKLQKKYGHTVTDAMNVAIEKGSKTKTRLKGMQDTATTRKLFYALSEIWMIPLVMFWQILAALPLVALVLDVGDTPSALKGTDYLWPAIVVYIIMLLVFNGHLLLLAGAVNVLTPLFILSLLFYPISVPICYSKDFKYKHHK